MPIKLRLVNSSDCKQLFIWVNDPAVRASAFNTNIINWQQHQAWFSQCLESDNCIIFIAEDLNQKPIGQVRFNQTDHLNVTVDISIDKDYRRKSLGLLLLTKANKKLLNETRFETIEAWIKTNNTASLTLFKKAGYIFKRESIKNNAPCQLVVYNPLKTHHAD